jgi:hypothetical protein
MPCNVQPSGASISSFSRIPDPFRNLLLLDARVDTSYGRPDQARGAQQRDARRPPSGDPIPRNHGYDRPMKTRHLGGVTS